VKTDGKTERDEWIFWLPKNFILKDVFGDMNTRSLSLSLSLLHTHTHTHTHKRGCMFVVLISQGYFPRGGKQHLPSSFLSLSTFESFVRKKTFEGWVKERTFLTAMPTWCRNNQNFFEKTDIVVDHCIFWFASFCYLYFSYFTTINQYWVKKSILKWLWPHFHLVYWMRWYLNPQRFDRESSLLTT